MVWQWCFNQYKIFGVCVFLWFDTETFYFLRLRNSFRFHPQHSISNQSTDDNEYVFFSKARDFYFNFCFRNWSPTIFSLSISISAHCFPSFSFTANMTEFAFIWRLRMAFLPTFSKCRSKCIIKKRVRREHEKTVSRLSPHRLYVLYFFLSMQWNEMKRNARAAVSRSSIPIYLWIDDFASCANSMEFLLSSPYEYYIGKRLVHHE